MVKGDEFYTESVKGFSEKAVFKVANLMAHKYELQKPEKATLLVRGREQLIVLTNGDVYKKAIY